MLFSEEVEVRLAHSENFKRREEKNGNSFSISVFQCSSRKMITSDDEDHKLFATQGRGREKVLFLLHGLLASV